MYVRLDKNGHINGMYISKVGAYQIEIDNYEDILNAEEGFDYSDFIVKDGKAVLSQLPEKRIAYLKSKLNETDYITAKAMDALLNTTSITEILTALKSIKEEYGEVLSNRESWRKEIQVKEDECNTQ